MVGPESGPGFWAHDLGPRPTALMFGPPALGPQGDPEYVPKTWATLSCPENGPPPRPSSPTPCRSRFGLEHRDASAVPSISYPVCVRARSIYGQLRLHALWSREPFACTDPSASWRRKESG